MSAKVKVVNPVWNGNGIIKRKVADYYVSEGRAEWIGEDQLRLVATHPKNQVAAERASAWWRENNPATAGRAPAVKFILPESLHERWVRIDGEPDCIFRPEPKLVFREGRKRPLLQYEGKKFFDDGHEENTAVIFKGKGKRPRLGVKAKFLPEISNSLPHPGNPACHCAACRLVRVKAAGGGRVPTDAELLAEHVIRTEDALRSWGLAKSMPNNKLFPGWGKGETGTCVQPEPARCYRWPERTPWF